MWGGSDYHGGSNNVEWYNKSVKIVNQIWSWARKNTLIIIASSLYPVAVLFDRFVLGGGVNEKGINERVIFVLFAVMVITFIGAILFAIAKSLFQRE